MSANPSNAKDLGSARAAELLNLRKASLARRAAALAAQAPPAAAAPEVAFAPAAVSATQTAGYVIALGDSWFDYPIPLDPDILKLLDEHGYNVESSAHWGDTLESIAYQGGQLAKFASNLLKVKSAGAVPKAVLISAGGDDIAGPEFGMLINNSNSAIAGWNSEVLDGVIDDRVINGYRYLLSYINQACQLEFNQTVPIILHGYDYPVPDGRGVLGGLIGPWLQPGFREKAFGDLTANAGLMRTIIDRFYLMLGNLAADPDYANVRIIDLRNTLVSDPGANYQASWANELHPTANGFQLVANKFLEALRLPQ